MKLRTRRVREILEDPKSATPDEVRRLAAGWLDAADWLGRHLARFDVPRAALNELADMLLGVK